MKTRMKKDRRGFTIIEVVLVLAIAGLIFLMIFIALPALQRSQRDAQRRDDMMFLVKRVKDYQSNNRGALPIVNPTGTTTGGYDSEAGKNTWSGFYTAYLGEGFKDPGGSDYNLKISQCGQGSIGSQCSNSMVKWRVTNDITDPNKKTDVLISVQASCNGEDAIMSSNPRKIAVQYQLEGGGIYCVST